MDEISKGRTVAGPINTPNKPKRVKWRITGRSILREREKGLRSLLHYSESPFISFQKYASTNTTVTVYVTEDLGLRNVSSCVACLPSSVPFLLLHLCLFSASLHLLLRWVSKGGFEQKERENLQCLWTQPEVSGRQSDRACGSVKCLIN